MQGPAVWGHWGKPSHATSCTPQPKVGYYTGSVKGQQPGTWVPGPLTSSSVFCFLATIPVLRASLFPPLRLPTWVKGQKTARVTGAGPALGGAEAH
jgi:hypothetical protein